MRVVNFSEARNSLKTIIDQVIVDANRLVYRVDGQELIVIACRYHYE